MSSGIGYPGIIFYYRRTRSGHIRSFQPLVNAELGWSFMSPPYPFQAMWAMVPGDVLSDVGRHSTRRQTSPNTLLTLYEGRRTSLILGTST